MGTSILMMKTQIGLGVLSIPLVFDTLGMIPGIIILLAIAIITTWVRGQYCIVHTFQTY
jgi:amino acid permease